ncbi:uncharacterized protein LACBIDRAFT_325699 [Laccaria bicolor S238N-H82]|uniref:Predicted protein n=1 Tax=Laccaria bicolor (strain S238N-H82 / ATCC MYA-4686) TaxID=486041 RepID=B0D5X3_LACBS|nr:uncharacterized protein LACBIDRAFT_325699 [Laccaria bicolor S238N-H82]EDR10098.1 predicted protein [Laccaria bicolor S238N-H82]|eukprot:XP_001879483.1 predicted protein [Laccaria bicolor S238N-H82]
MECSASQNSSRPDIRGTFPNSWYPAIRGTRSVESRFLTSDPSLYRSRLQILRSNLVWFFVTAGYFPFGVVAIHLGSFTCPFKATAVRCNGRVCVGRRVDRLASHLPSSNFDISHHGCILAFVSTITSLVIRENVGEKATFLEGQNPDSIRSTRSGIRRTLMPTPSQAPDQEMSQSNIEIEASDQEISQSNIGLEEPTPSQVADQEMSQFNIKTQPAQYLDQERQKIRAKNVRKRVKRFRVLIIGRANAGKTTILQRVCNTTKLPKIFNPQGHKIDLSELNPTAKRGEHNIENEMIFDSNPGYVFHDSCGFEAGRTLELDDVKSFIQHRSTATHMEKQLHAIWYCIPMNDRARPITRAELDFFDECGTGIVPVIILFTKADLLDAPTIGKLVKTGMSIEDAASKAGEESINNFHKDFGHMLYAKKYPPKTHIYLRDMQNTRSDCSVLVKKTAAVLSDDAILKLFLSVQQNQLSLSMEYAVKSDIRVMFDSQGHWLKTREKQMITIKNILEYFQHIDYLKRDFDADFDSDFDADAYDFDAAKAKDNQAREANEAFFFNNADRIPEYNALHCVDWRSRRASLCIATAIIAEHSYFIWKKQPSKSAEPIKKSFHMFQSSAAINNIHDAIKELDEGHRDIAAALVKIALDNRLSL